MVVNKVSKVLATLVVVTLISLAFTAIAVADPPAGNKLDICHNQMHDYVDDLGNVTQPAGWYLLEVAKKSFDKHHAKHGDFKVMSVEDELDCLEMEGFQADLRPAR